MSNAKSNESFGHCAICVEATVQGYRKHITPENCTHCKAYEAGKARAFAMAADTVHELYLDMFPSPTLGVRKFYAAILDNLVETP